MQLSIFDYNYKELKINKPIRLIELFAGYGSQNLALKYLGANYDSWKICEWAIKSIQAYKDLHCNNDNTDYSKELSKNEIINYLFKKGISNNYNEPMSLKQISRLKEDNLRIIYNNIQATHNFVNIQSMHSDDLNIIDRDKYTYLMTYSFPCQDLSLAGKGKGMDKYSGTRSGMLWEVERLLDECNGNLPQILLMENVTQVHGKKNLDNFNNWKNKLESLGYKNYWQDLNAKDYGIPQNRNRCFMISILSNCLFEFPEKEKLILHLKDLLEENVDEKYYLSDSMKKYIIADNSKWTENNDKSLINKTIASTLNTGEGSKRCDASNYICNDLPENYNLKTKNKRLINMINKINFNKDNIFVDVYNQSTSENAGTITTRVNASNSTAIYKNYRIRKLTPKECFRLMGVKDEDFEKIAKNQSNSSLYHLAGDSIVVNVLMKIFDRIL